MSAEHKYFPNLLLVAGTGRNTGKTSFVTAVCQIMPVHNKPICIKISPHFHEQKGSKCIVETEKFRIFEETEICSKKDSVRMLQAGAKQSFFIEADNEQAYLALCYLLEMLPLNTPLICESGNLRNYLKPAVFILLHTNGSQPKISTLAFFELADKVIVSDIGCLNFDKIKVRYHANKWNLSI